MRGQGLIEHSTPRTAALVVGAAPTPRKHWTLLMLKGALICERNSGITQGPQRNARRSTAMHTARFTRRGVMIPSQKFTIASDVCPTQTPAPARPSPLHRDHRSDRRAGILHLATVAGLGRSLGSRHVVHGRADFSRGTDCQSHCSDRRTQRSTAWALVHRRCRAREEAIRSAQSPSAVWPSHRTRQRRRKLTPHLSKSCRRAPPTT